MDVLIKDKIYITDEEIIKELYKGYKKELWQTSEQFATITKYSYLCIVPLTDEQVHAELEIKNTKYLISISLSLNFFVILTVIPFVVFFIALFSNVKIKRVQKGKYLIKTDTNKKKSY